jgi:hypothetical protein
LVAAVDAAGATAIAAAVSAAAVAELVYGLITALQRVPNYC